jgi:hypothetical protein
MNDLSCSLHPSNELVVFERSRPLFTFFFFFLTFVLLVVRVSGLWVSSGHSR